MKGLWLFLHVMGFTAWLGGGLAVMLSGITAKYFPAEQRLAVYRIMSVVSRNLIGPGAVLVVVSGFVLSVPYFKSATAPSTNGAGQYGRHSLRRIEGRSRSFWRSIISAASGFH